MQKHFAKQDRHLLYILDLAGLRAYSFSGINFSQTCSHLIHTRFPFVPAAGSRLEIGANSDKEKAVRNAWKVLLDHFVDLSAPNTPSNSNEKTAALTASLLLAMGKSLDYDFDEVQIKKGAYYPMGLGYVEQELHALRRGLLDVLSGKRRIPVGVFEDKFPEITSPSPELQVEELPTPEKLAVKKLSG